MLKLIDYLHNIYLRNNQNIQHASNKNKDSSMTLNAIEAGRLILEKKGGKLLLFNSSNSWIRSSNINLEASKKFNMTPKNELIYTTLDPESYLTILGRKLSSSLISLDIFQSSSYSAGKSLTVSL